MQLLHLQQVAAALQPLLDLLLRLRLVLARISLALGELHLPAAAQAQLLPMAGEQQAQPLCLTLEATVRGTYCCWSRALAMQLSPASRACRCCCTCWAIYPQHSVGTAPAWRRPGRWGPSSAAA